MNIKYDADVIIKFAADLYQKADRMILSSTILFALLGGVIGLAIGFKSSPIIIGLFCCIVAGFLGYIYGQMKAFMLRLEAQRALCNVEIERNTRKS